jgi:ankyrin repeat protein
VNARDSSGMTPLMIASHTGNSKMITLLLKSGADPHAKLGGVAKSPPRPRRTGTRSPKPRRRKRGSV